MYGGVSLAIYINGIAQELFRMVRSTANAGKDAAGKPCALSGFPDEASDSNKLRGTERVYRKLSYLLSDDQLLAQYREFLSASPETKPPEDIAAKLEADVCHNRRPINTRFIVDILSGTSAGGINAIHLSKALVNDQQINQLRNLWINEGDISLLINDKASVTGLALANQSPPQSLLNSRRMYLKLLKSLDDMGGEQESQAPSDSPYMDELDLFITTTDIEGMPLPLRLADTVVYERRHRNVFHFRYAGKEATGEYHSDFKREDNPFLAFAARCTSSFPFAFEPMRLCDIDEVLEEFDEYRRDQNCRAESEKWKRFFEEPVAPVDHQSQGQADKQRRADFKERAFGDGGYLDNKPFSYAIEMLSHRHSTVPVDRKLIYIEPSPEHPELAGNQVKDKDGHQRKPDAISNVKAAILDLPGYETIREDLQRVLERNRFINRVNRLISGIEKGQYSEEQKKRLREALPRLGKGEWLELDLAKMVEKYGPFFLSYHRLRIAATTDDLTSLVALAAGFDENSDHFFAIRCLIRAWREVAYPEYHSPTDGRSGKTLNCFLQDFDLRYQLRRLNFLRSKIDQLYRCSHQLLKEPHQYPTPQRLEEIVGESFITRPAQDPDYNQTEVDFSGLNEEKKQQFQQALFFIKYELSELYKELVALQARLRSKPPLKTSSGADAQADQREDTGEKAATATFLAEDLQGLRLTSAHLDYILGLPWKGESPSSASNSTGFNAWETANSKQEEECVQRAKELLNISNDDKFGLQKLRPALDKVADRLAERLHEVLLSQKDNRCGRIVDSKVPLKDFASGRCRQVDMQSLNQDYVRAIRNYLRPFYRHFDFYDQISFPILYNTDVGEADAVEVIRISPEDATSLIDEKEERRNSTDGKPRRKLAGTALYNFGAFLDRVWRQNDIMWGRLDGAERLITALLPDKKNEKVRAALIEEAHQAILIEEMPLESRQALSSLMTEALMRVGAGDKPEEAVDKVTQPLAQAVVKTKLETVMRNRLDNKELLAFIRDGYEVNRQLDPKPMLRALSRSTQVIGKVFEDIANQNNLDGKSLAWIARLGQMFWGLVELAVPDSILNLLFFHWLKILYAFEVLTIVLGTVLSRSGATQFGWTAFGITATLNIIVLTLRDLMRGKNAVKRATALVVCVIVLLLAALGLLEILGSIFGVKVGDPKTEKAPLDWVKQNIRSFFPAQGWMADHLPHLLGLFLIIVVIAVLNAIGTISLRRWWHKLSRWLKKKPKD